VSAVDFAVAVLFLLFAMLVVAFGHGDITRVFAGSGTSGDAASVFLLVGYGISCAVLLWSGVAVLGDRLQRALVAQIISTPLALLGTGLVT